MLSFLTLMIDYGAMVITLWLAFYLLGRGFPNQITLRAVIVLLALSFFFSSAFLNHFYQIPGATAMRAILLVVGLITWYSLTFQLLSAQTRKRLRWFGRFLYAFSVLTAVLLIGKPVFIGEAENLLWVGRMNLGPPYTVYAIFQGMVCAGILYNLLSGDKIGLKPQGQPLLLASLIPILAAGYGILALAITRPLPRLFQDLLIFSGVFLFGLSVARYQILVERRTTLQDLPISGLVMLVLASVYALLAWRLGLQPMMIGAFTMLAILTHSIYDLGREFLERQRVRNESAFRHQLRQLESESFNEESLQRCLEEGLALLRQTLHACGGFIALRRGEVFVVAASQRAVPIGTHLPAAELECEDICQPKSEKLPDITWIAPAFEANTQMAAVGLACPLNKLDYSSDDLDLLSEVAERVGTIVSLNSARPNRDEKLRQLIDEIKTDTSTFHMKANEMMAAMTTNPDPELVKMLEEGLRNLNDYIVLGELPLNAWVGANGESLIERGKQLQQILLQAIETLRPPGKRPAEPLPRIWYNYSVLYDAYVDCVPNREIMARLYISEGTFNRIRRNALRGLARCFAEREKAILSAG